MFFVLKLIITIIVVLSIFNAINMAISEGQIETAIGFMTALSNANLIGWMRMRVGFEMAAIPAFFHRW